MTTEETPDDASDPAVRPANAADAAPDCAESAATAGRSAANRASLPRAMVRGLGGAYLLYHLCALTVANLPNESVLAANLHAPFSTYLNATSQWQIWNMFTSRPRLLSVDPSIAVVWGDGSKEQVPPLLPGPAPYTGELKLYAFMSRVVPTNDGGADTVRYAQAMCRALTKQYGRTPKSVQLIMPAETIRAPKQIQRDGRIAVNLIQRGAVRSCQ